MALLMPDVPDIVIDHGFARRVLDGRARIEQLPAQLAATAELDDEAAARQLGIPPSCVATVRAVPDAFRMLLHAARFSRTLTEPGRTLASQSAVRARALQLAARDLDPFEIAELEAWADQLLDAAEAVSHA